MTQTAWSCAEVVKDLINASSEAGQLSLDVKNIVIKQAIGSALPDSYFLETISTEAKAAAEAADSSAKVTLIDETGLDTDGYINLTTAKALLLNQLGGEAFDAFYSNYILPDNSYIFTVVVNGVESSHRIDAITGLISDATAEDLLDDPDSYEYEPEPDYDEIYEEEYIDIPVDIEPTDSTTEPEAA